MVRDVDHERWVRRYFAGVDENELALAFPFGATSWSNKDELVEWHQCRRPTAEELSDVCRLPTAEELESK